MANYAYEREIPDAPNNPSSDQPKMKINTNSIDSLINEDHISFNQNNGGFHRHTRMPEVLSIPIGLIASSGTTYVKLANGRSQIFYTNETSGNEYQLTRVNNTDFPNFGKNNPYGTPPAGYTQVGGWTFLPGNGGNVVGAIAATGGMLFQYGFFGRTANTAALGQIQFPKSFTVAPFSIQAILYHSASSGNTLVIDSTTPPSTGAFNYRTPTNSADGIFWTAIGI